MRALVLLVISLAISGCTSSPRPPEFGTGLVIPGGGNDISLGGFWFNLEGNGVSPANRTPVDTDPIGGFLYLYWVDEEGNACHGQPGVSGQPGPFQIKAYQTQALELSDTQATITTTQLVDFQRIDYRLAPYLEGREVSGLHFVQYGGRFWRSRSTGSILNWRGAPILFSVPMIISVDADTTNTLFPYLPDAQNVCNLQGNFLPSVVSQSRQNPDMCAVRAFPGTDSMDYSGSLGYCLTELPHGLEPND